MGIISILLPSLAAFLLFRWAISAWRAYNSPLSALPGPWYAPFTNIHLQIGFARGTVWRQVEAAHAKYGGMMRLGPRQIWVSDKVALKQIISQIDLNKVMMYAEMSRDKNSAGLFGEVRPNEHKRLRKLMTPAFTVGYLDQMDHLFQKPVEDMMNLYKSNLKPKSAVDGMKVNLMTDLHKIALEVIGECAFGRGFGSVAPDTEPEPGFSKEQWQKIPDNIAKGLSMRYAIVFLKRSLRKLGIHMEFDWPTEMVAAIESVITRRRAGHEAGRQDLVQHLIDNGVRPDNGQKMSARDILDQLSELMLAGAETTSATMCYFMMELARNPDVRKKLFKDLPALGLDDPLITGVEVRQDPRFAYLTACMQENLRMHPIASEFGRRTTDKPVVLNGFEVPPYTVVSASYRALHYNEEYWPQPHRFWPERFLPIDHPLKGDAPNADTSAYYPFSSGKHSCVGMNFAWHEMRVVLANYCARFDITEEPGQKEDIRQYITMQFHDGNWNARLYPRL
ncbi:unnamed protein product [Zymoseptoria tritici ST99CH_1A5]|uniref:Cytochrome P450 n=1 Tax=Zymoseptoria tritici ST99CH_1A5 TaxID=1276529 RepID=A0A1Y6LCE0_ZYMTR|nr:unnamed protein product [Zymoseptoria tritici ST99CH_1A5]